MNGIRKLRPGAADAIHFDVGPRIRIGQLQFDLCSLLRLWFWPDEGISQQSQREWHSLRLANKSLLWMRKVSRAFRRSELEGFTFLRQLFSNQL